MRINAAEKLNDRIRTIHACRRDFPGELSRQYLGFALKNPKPEGMIRESLQELFMHYYRSGQEKRWDTRKTGQRTETNAHRPVSGMNPVSISPDHLQLSLV